MYFHLHGLFLRLELVLLYAKGNIQEEEFFTRKFDVQLKKKLVKCHTWNCLCMVLKTGHLGK